MSVLVFLFFFCSSFFLFSLLRLLRHGNIFTISMETFKDILLPLFLQYRRSETAHLDVELTEAQASEEFQSDTLTGDKEAQCFGKMIIVLICVFACV